MAEFQKLLKEQSTMKVVLNGGNQEIDDATVPFTVGFDDSVVNREPKYLLVLDIPYKRYQSIKDKSPIEEQQRIRNILETAGERTLYNLNKVDFMQFHSPGKHNLIFILLQDIPRESKKAFLQRANLRSEYQHPIYFYNIEKMNHQVVGYCEELVEIPEQFFSIVPETGLRKGWWNWVNRWFLTDPVDQCEFRKRATIALTIQPIVWFLGLLVRSISGILLSVAMLLIGFLAFLIGLQSKKMFANVGTTLGSFVFMYPRSGWEDIFNTRERWFDADAWAETYKQYSFGKWKLQVPISPAGLAFQIVLWWALVLCVIGFVQTLSVGSAFGYLFTSALLTLLIVWHLVLVVAVTPDNDTNKVITWLENHFSTEDEKFDAMKVWGYFTLIFFSEILLFLITQVYHHRILLTHGAVQTETFVLSKLIFVLSILAVVLLVIFRKETGKFLSKGFRQFNTWYAGSTLRKWMRKSYQTIVPEFAMSYAGGSAIPHAQPKLSKGEIRRNYLKQTYDINMLPAKVNLTQAVAPTKVQVIVQKFKIGFWTTKAKVCKPYAK